VDALCEDGGNLSLPDQSVDFIFANFYLPWQTAIEPVLREWRRVLRPDGLLMLTALGPDTFKEYAEQFADSIIPHWLDMHDLGDLLLKVGFSDPVLDACHYTTVYKEPDKLARELKHSAMLSAESSSASLTPSEDGSFTLTYEVIHAHAFAPSANTSVSPVKDGIVRIPVSQIKR